ncbi:uncharacterized protein EV422DRAFT_343392 [Fimicolochytrium jonesii]|uniref:uncharacterized protein n=1 Tax=Fimicolochytrium jonesii TaxID=1396493 RepID=UPI0022FEA32D|nr:uncharacterized protein EV422DRAFT_343392 [Fimicolochytrium jonesii]KAI8815752.1 hypothetical protein EV422DRAFT_343392 [Fimicolochytrium jonesii]
MLAEEKPPGSPSQVEPVQSADEKVLEAFERWSGNGFQGLSEVSDPSELITRLSDWLRTTCPPADVPNDVKLREWLWELGRSFPTFGSWLMDKLKANILRETPVPLSSRQTPSFCTAPAAELQPEPSPSALPPRPSSHPVAVPGPSRRSISTSIESSPRQYPESLNMNLNVNIANNPASGPTSPTYPPASYYLGPKNPSRREEKMPAHYGHPPHPSHQHPSGAGTNSYLTGGDDSDPSSGTAGASSSSWHPRTTSPSHSNPHFGPSTPIPAPTLRTGINLFSSTLDAYARYGGTWSTLIAHNTPQPQPPPLHPLSECHQTNCAGTSSSTPLFCAHQRALILPREWASYDVEEIFDRMVASQRELEEVIATPLGRLGVVPEGSVNAVVDTLRGVEEEEGGSGSGNESALLGGRRSRTVSCYSRWTIC